MYKSLSYISSLRHLLKRPNFYQQRPLHSMWNQHLHRNSFVNKQSYFDLCLAAFLEFIFLICELTIKMIRYSRSVYTSNGWNEFQNFLSLLLLLYSLLRGDHLSKLMLKLQILSLSSRTYSRLSLQRVCIQLIKPSYLQRMKYILSESLILQMRCN